MEFFSLETAKRTFKSKTKPYPFLIAHECYEPYIDNITKENKIRNRKFYAFDDIESFLSSRSMYPHAHEIVFNRFSEKQQGRLVFDFDYEESWHGIPKIVNGELEGFVPPDFHERFENLIKKTFQKFYTGIDVSRFEFIWLVSKKILQDESDTTKVPISLEKWSKHLIVKNAYFSSNWKVQMQMFYQLLLTIAYDEKIFPEMPNLEKLVDIQVARSNATMRMCGSTKYGKNNVLQLDKRSELLEFPFTGERSHLQRNFYDTLIQLYRREDIEKEQYITESQLSHKELHAVSLEKSISNEFFREAMKIINIDLNGPKVYSSETLTEQQVALAIKCLEMYHELVKIPNPFQMKDVGGSRIDLKRTSPGKCLLSGRVHEHENAYMIVYANEVRLFCHRGCKLNGQNFIQIYVRN